MQMMQEIKGQDYIVSYDRRADWATVVFQGSLSLTSSADYAPIAQLLQDALTNQPASLILNLRSLEFINSSGISVLSRFVLKARNQPNTQLVVQGTETVIWQTRSLKNLQRLMPTLVLEWASDP
jgi:anti-anti-sigma factor